MSVFDDISDPGPRPSDPGPEPSDPTLFKERAIWHAQVASYRRWVRQSQRFQLAQLAKKLEATRDLDAHPIVEAVVLLSSIVLSDLAVPEDVFSLFAPR